MDVETEALHLTVTLKVGWGLSHGANFQGLFGALKVGDFGVQWLQTAASLVVYVAYCLYGLPQGTLETIFWRLIIKSLITMLSLI